jgi:hypothetical protein
MQTRSSSKGSASSADDASVSVVNPPPPQKSQTRAYTSGSPEDNAALLKALSKHTNELTAGGMFKQGVYRAVATELNLLPTNSSEKRLETCKSSGRGYVFLLYVFYLHPDLHV